MTSTMATIMPGAHIPNKHKAVFLQLRLSTAQRLALALGTLTRPCELIEPDGHAYFFD